MSKPVRISALLVTAALLTACAGPAPPTLKWERVAPLPTDADLNALASARGLTVAAGEGGTILTTTDGRTWSLRPTDTAADLYAVAAAPAGFVAAGDGVILTSTDGITWTARTGAAGRHLRAAACGPQTCVAVGEGGVALTGKLTGKWAAVTVGTTNDLNAIAYSKGRFVAVGAKGAAFASADGRAWTPVQMPLPEAPRGFYNDLTAITVVQDQWVANGAGWGNFAVTSGDGEHWELRESGKDYTRLMAADGGQVLRLAFREKATCLSLLSTDQGVTWKTETNNLTAWPFMNALVWDGQQFLLAGRDGIVMASADGISWERRFPQGPANGGWSSIAFGAGRFVAVANGDIGTSADGLKWEILPRPKDRPYLRSIVRGPDRFVATGIGVYTSPDGVTWTPQAVPKDWPLGPVVWGNGRYVALRSNQTITSADGTAWQMGPALGPERYFEGLVAGEGGFVAYSQTVGGAHNEIYTSTDGLTWTSQGLQPRIESMTFGKGLYVAFTGNATVITSPDGKQWTETDPGVKEGFKVFFTRDRFLAMGADTVLTSSDGRKWTPAGRQPARHGITGMASGNGRTVAVGGSGSIIASDAIQR